MDERRINPPFLLTMSAKESKVGNIFIGDQISFVQMRRFLFGTVMGFGYTDANGRLQPYLKIAEYPEDKILVPQVERIVNRGKRH
ncbi:MAG TPA: hypothetical protein PKY82_23875 [Pyrinomonadaceae bacterium]|nr:hypothetical protein [Pyrinomonadaceae bacterium]